MVKTASTMLPLGTVLPDFELEIVQGTNYSRIKGLNSRQKIHSQSFSGKPLLVMVICAHCPFVKHIENGLTSLAKDFQRDVQFLAVSSNSLITHPEDSPQFLAVQANKNEWDFPYLIDSEQTFAKSLKAACTPDFFLFSPSLEGKQRLRYRGQLDGSRPGNNIEVSGEDLRLALNLVVKGEDVFNNQQPSIGCNIKWDPGHEPEWFG